MYLHLKFENAKLFAGKYFDKKKFNKRYNPVDDSTYEKQGLTFVEPITIHQISNIIHVLFGERPVPTLRASVYDKNEYYFNIAKKSFIKLNNNSYIKDDKNIIFSETTTVMKYKHNAHSNDNRTCWEYIRRYLGDDNLSIFINKLNNILKIKNVDTIPINYVRDMLVEYQSSSEYVDLIEWLKSNKKLAVNGFLQFKSDMNQFSPNNNSKNILDSTKLTYINGVDSVVKYSGELIIPITHNDLNHIKSVSTGVMSLLDGGLVYIVGVKNDFMPINFVEVKHISLEEYNYENKN